ncbi:MAG: hypothetical protein AABX70_02335 [Nanoarchaeota archaeon]
MNTPQPNQDLLNVVNDIGNLIEPDRISNTPELNQVRFGLHVPKILFRDPEPGVLNFALSMPYQVGGENEEYLVTPVRLNGFGNRAMFNVGFTPEGSAFRQYGQMSPEAAKELTEKFIKYRPGLENAVVTLEKVSPTIYETPQNSLRGPALNAFHARGNVQVTPPYKGWAKMAEVGLVGGLWKYVTVEKEKE